MNDLMERLHRLGDQPASITPDETLRGDLLRARAGARRRRVQVGVAGLAVAGLALGGVAAGVAGVAGLDGDGRQGQAPAPHVAAPDQGELRLVAYEGEQQPGFVVEKVPEGFVLQGATPFNLNVARAGDDSHIDDYREKLVVMLESKSVTGPPQGEPVDVGGLDGWFRTGEDGTQTLTYDDGDHRVVVQAWHTLGLTQEQVIEFAEGVTVTDEAQAGVG